MGAAPEGVAFEIAGSVSGGVGGGILWRVRGRQFSPIRRRSGQAASATPTLRPSAERNPLTTIKAVMNGAPMIGPPAPLRSLSHLR
jgi:hypothetical protein